MSILRWPWSKPDGETARREARLRRNESVVRQLGTLAEELRGSVDRLERLAERLEAKSGGTDAR